MENQVLYAVALVLLVILTLVTVFGNDHLQPPDWPNATA